VARLPAEVRGSDAELVTEETKEGTTCRASAVRLGREQWDERKDFGLAAVDARVADVLPLDDVDDVFSDVGGVVADPFEIFGDED
jgi:hypothetical protein